MGVLQQQLLGLSLLIIGTVILIGLVKRNKPKNFKTFKRHHPLLGAVVGSDYFYGRLQGMLPAAICICGLPLLHVPPHGYMLIGCMLVVVYVGVLLGTHSKIK